MSSKVEWATVVVHFFKADQPGRRVAGRVVRYDPSKGGKTYKGEPCGFVDLASLSDFGVIHRVTLDKPQLADKVAAADPRPGSLLGVKFVGEVEGKGGDSYKQFAVFVGREELPARVDG